MTFPQFSRIIKTRKNVEIEFSHTDISRRVEEANLTLADYETAKKKIVAENADLLRQIEEVDSNNMTLNKIR